MSVKHGEREGGRQDKREALERGSRRNQPYILLVRSQRECPFITASISGQGEREHLTGVVP